MLELQINYFSIVLNKFDLLQSSLPPQFLWTSDLNLRCDKPVISFVTFDTKSFTFFL